MDPVTAGLAIVGLGMSLYGGMGQAAVSKQQAAVSSDIAGQEQNINVQKQQQAQLEERRSSLQNMRQAQQMRAQATAAATNQNAQFGSGLKGGIAGVTNQENQNQEGLNQNWQTSQNIFGYNSAINSDKMQLASLGGTAATYAGISSLGGSLTSNAKTIGGLGKDAGAGLSNMNFGNMFMGGGSPTGL